MKVLLFCAFGLKTPIQAPQNWGFWGFLPLKREAVTTEPPKGICGCANTSFGANIIKIGAIIAEISQFFDIFKMDVAC